MTRTVTYRGKQVTTHLNGCGEVVVYVNGLFYARRPLSRLGSIFNVIRGDGSFVGSKTKDAK